MNPEISKRDFFAAAALTGLLSRPQYSARVSEAADDAFLIADEMLKQSIDEEATYVPKPQDVA